MGLKVCTTTPDLFLLLRILFIIMCICASEFGFVGECECSAVRNQKRALDPQKLTLQVVASAMT